MRDKPEIDLETYRKAAEFQRIGGRAVRRAIEENRRLGVPNAFFINGKTIYELPNGELTTENPFEKIPS
jgi:hypothetical protein